MTEKLADQSSLGRWSEVGFDSDGQIDNNTFITLTLEEWGMTPFLGQLELKVAGGWERLGVQGGCIHDWIP